ncbi:hypothetical protein [Fischerella sp. PCC 9605]|uniref:hypothetical protein n=1 Tax=Fischerella sp. PCC 9605 TaxID=1173024 RepID=UPI00047DCD1B|nr:hypothetical protein [Fischerella sp. PCC 9605]
MTTWIVTTGNIDVQILRDRKNNWGSLYSDVRDDLVCNEFANLSKLNPYDRDSNYTAPARVIGCVYGHRLDDYQDLIFPLLDTFCRYFQQKNIKPERIIVLLTDQSQIFSEEQILYASCPYWQDTCTLKPILTWYLHKNLGIKPEFETLEPTKLKHGLDHWNETLLIVKQTFQKLKDNPLKTVYLSHQAGTPAISSAVQFVSLGQFKKVEFVLSNYYYDDNYNLQSEPDIIPSSEYGRGIQIQKAKQLIISGFPGAALKILEGIERIKPNIITELNQMVDFFNLYRSDTDTNDDLTVEASTQRIVDSLDLLGIFFSHKNYLQGIALLMAAHETFLKAAILSKVQKLNSTINLEGVIWSVYDLVKWLPLGLFLNQSLQNASIDTKKQALTAVNFPVINYRLESDSDFNVTNKNFALLAWLQALEPNIETWNLMKRYCKKEPEFDKDLRNQLVHNLCGMKDTDVVKYLRGSKTECGSDVMKIYNEHVKEPFFKALQLLELPFTREKLQKRLQEIANML